jgi:hypothetical protein
MKKNFEMLKIYPLLVCFILFIFSCHSARDSAEVVGIVNLSAVAKKSAKYVGEKINMEGVYLGWKHANCQFPASFISEQITRSDWAFSDGKRCCYITGGIPAGLESSPENPVPIKLTVLVKQKDAKLYFEYVSSILIK